MSMQDKLASCLIGGAIGDALGYAFEGASPMEKINFDVDWMISDDTQLTLATIEAIFDQDEVLPERIANSFLQWV